MTGFSHSFAFPKNHQDFEDLCVRIFRAHWGIANVQRLGRQGHAQWGIDIIGESGGKVHACQVKHHEQGKRLLWREDVAEEVKKARGFEMPLHTYVVATTAPTDPKLQQQVLALSLERVRKGVMRRCLGPSGGS